MTRAGIESIFLKKIHLGLHYLQKVRVLEFSVYNLSKNIFTDMSLTADPGVASLIPARSHTFVEIDHEIISTVIHLPSAESFKKGCCQVQAKVCAQSTSQVNRLFKLAQEKVWLGELTVPT